MEKKNWYILLIATAAIASCNSKQPADKEPAAAAEEVKTPVTVTHVDIVSLKDSIELNATSSFLQNNYVKSNANGYVKSVHAKLGEYVPQGKVLFTIETKESMVIGNSINSLDSSFKFTGVNSIVASGHGYITQLNHQAGDYVQDGEQLAIVSDMNSFVFLLNLPYELKPYIMQRKPVELYLPDGTKLQGNIVSLMPTVDSASQTQTVIIKVVSKTVIPQNLIAKVRIVKDVKNNAQTVPKSAILSDESQTDFWVMKMIDSVTAAKVSVRKGLELKDKVEILEPVFSKTDQILLTGNYGLPDTAKVIIEKE